MIKKYSSNLVRIILRLRSKITSDYAHNDNVNATILYIVSANLAC